MENEAYVSQDPTVPVFQHEVPKLAVRCIPDAILMENGGFLHLPKRGDIRNDSVTYLRAASYNE